MVKLANPPSPPSASVRGNEVNGPRVLYLTKVYPYPPATAGDAVYSRGIIEALSGVCRLSVVCADNGGVRPGPSGIEWHIVGQRKDGQAGSVWSHLPLIAWKGATPSYSAAVRTLLTRDWEAIVLDNIGSAHVLPQAEAYRVAHRGTRLIYVSHEYEYPTRAAKYAAYRLNLVKRILTSLDLAKVCRWERALLRRCDVVTVINTSDLEAFRKISFGRKYLPLSPGYNGDVADHRHITPDTPRRLLLVGGRRSEQKRQILIDWLEAAYQRLNTAGIGMTVVGDMDDGLREILARKYPRVEVLGFVDDLAGLFASARMGVIADTVGGGFKLRLLSHVFLRLPMVGLSDAIDGLPTGEGHGYLGAPDLPSLVDLVERSVDDVDLLDRLQKRALTDCAEAYSWEARAQSFVKVLCGHDEELVS